MYDETVILNHVRFATELAKSRLRAKDVAERANVAPVTVSRARNGHPVRISIVERLADVFSIPAADLIAGREGC